MNFLWTIILVGSGFLFLFNDPSLMLSTATSSIYESLKLCFTLGGIYIFWLGIIQIMEDCGIAKLLAKILTPFIYFIFGNLSREASELIAINISANILGLGNASLPAGLKAMDKLQNSERKNDMQIVMLFAVNCCSIQLLPSTIILLRNENGSANASDIIFPIILVSIICFAMTISLIKLLFSGKIKKKKVVLQWPPTLCQLLLYWFWFFQKLKK